MRRFIWTMIGIAYVTAFLVGYIMGDAEYKIRLIREMANTWTKGFREMVDIFNRQT